MKTDPYKKLNELGGDVHEMAEQIFEACGACSDFAYQGNLVFGSTNRIKLTSRGWIADTLYCNPDFLRKFERYMEGLHPDGPDVVKMPARIRDDEGVCLDCNQIDGHSILCSVPAFEAQQDEKHSWEDIACSSYDDGDDIPWTQPSK